MKVTNTSLTHTLPNTFSPSHFVSTDYRVQPCIHFARQNSIIIGASRGISAGLAIELARRGADVGNHRHHQTREIDLCALQVALVSITSWSEGKAKCIASDIPSLNNGSKAHIVRADLKQIEAPKYIVASTGEAFGDNIDILANAGVLCANPIEEATAKDYTGIFNVNVRAPLLLIKAVVPHLQKPGRFMSLSPVKTRIGPPNMSLYAVSNATIEGMTKSLARGIGDASHTVNAVAPAHVKSEMLGGVPRDGFDVQLKTTAVEYRVGTADDIARIVCWLASVDSKWVSEQTISASGGIMMLYRHLNAVAVCCVWMFQRFPGRCLSSKTSAVWNRNSKCADANQTVQSRVRYTSI